MLDHLGGVPFAPSLPSISFAQQAFLDVGATVSAQPADPVGPLESALIEPVDAGDHVRLRGVWCAWIDRHSFTVPPRTRSVRRER